jgi:hypothetical protein
VDLLAREKGPVKRQPRAESPLDERRRSKKIVDAATDRAVAAGATPEREPSDEPYGRAATIRDPFGHRWLVHGPIREPAALVAAPRHGDLAYVSLRVPDAGVLWVPARLAV